MSYKPGKTSTVPKFSSFKPKVETSQPQSEKADEPRQHGGHSSHQKRDRHDPAIVASHQADKTRHLKPSQQPSPHEQDGGALFVYDKRGDPLIRRYGGNNRREIPNYRRFGSGRILGVDGYMRIDKTRSRDEFFILGYHESRSLLSGDRKSVLAKGGHHKSQSVRVRREESQTVTGLEDFVPLRSSKKRKRDGAESEDALSEDEPSYRSIYGKSKNHEHSDSDVDYASDASAGPRDRAADDPVRFKSIELSRRVRDHPEDIDAWFELVNHQDILLRISGQDGRHPTTAEVKSFADIKLSMLEQAYSHASTDSQREKLQLRIMREGSKIWDATTISKRWEEALKEQGSSFGLWREYTNFQQSRLSSFQYEEIKQLYIEQLQRLQTEASTEQLKLDRVRIHEQIIYVFLRATRFISDAGYRELAVAAWQATLELTFARPSTLPEQSEVKIPSTFQDYWESEVPRIGEEAAQGWAAFERSDGVLEPPEPRSSNAFMSPNTRDGYKAWSIIEQHKARVATNPARTMDDGAEDDPFRVVMYADIQDLLLYLPKEDIPHIHGQLLDAFLVFCHLPPSLSSSSIVQDILQDDFIVRSPASLATETSLGLVTSFEEENKRPPEFSHDYQRMSVTPNVLFSSPRWFKYMEKIRDDVPADLYRWMSTTLKHLVRMFEIRGLAPYYLAFESVNEPGNEKKTAKALLKQDSTNISLYLGYSILEWARGNKDVARTTLAAAMGLKTIMIHSRVSLGIAAAWMELEDNNLTRSILQLCALSYNSSATSILESPTASPAQILKARQFLSSNRDYLLSSGDAENAIIYAEALTLLEYLTQQSNKEPSSGSQGDIWSAITSISSCSDDLVARGLGSSSSHERLLQSAARLLYYHASQGPFRPGFLREQLAKYINLFPQNTIFLELFAWREARLSIDDRVRSMLDKVVLVEPYDCISSRIFAIRHESRTGNIHSTRAAFEHALESEACKNHPGLWISYIRFCHERKELRSKTKGVFYRALQCCPWSKEVFMEAFATLVRDMDSSELKSVYNTLCEKGLRVHVEMEEFVEKWRREHKEKDKAKR
ncbi:DUF1740-domain-containing protein [Hypoxylon crocopeplum]|nr:DUF1740-domain-containing protein [Hypoxylon crocopeplum]